MKLLIPFFLFTFSVSLTSADIPSPACHNPMPRTPPIGKSPFVTNTWNFLELLSGTQQFLQMTSTMRDSTRTLYMQLRDLNMRGRIETYEPREPRVPNPVREVPVRENQAPGMLREPPRIVREVPGTGTGRGTPRTSDRDTFRTSDRGTATGKMEALAGEGALPGSTNTNNNMNINNQKINTNERQQPALQYRLFGNEVTAGGMFNPNPENSNQLSNPKKTTGFLAYNTPPLKKTSPRTSPESQSQGQSLFNPQNRVIPGLGFPRAGEDSGTNNQQGPVRNLFSAFMESTPQVQEPNSFNALGRLTADWAQNWPGESNKPGGTTGARNSRINDEQFVENQDTRWPPQDLPRRQFPPNNQENPIVVGDSIEEEEKEGDNQPGGMEIETQPSENTRGRLQKRGDEDTPGSVRDKKLPALYANPLRAFQTSIENFWSPIFDFLVSDTYLGFNQDQIRPAWQVGLPWREYGNTLKKVSTILQVWQKDREVKQKVLTVEQLEAKFGHLLQAMTLGRLVTPYQRRLEDEVPIEEDDEELTVEEPSYG
ncbi:hypothetical protein TWF788_006080 [Orbilia oligospora]|uniref:Secreted protein n=2 Tax=Orbilia oligospora TaxID=2813651 RepID=A0A7C8U695_ORBOL|nr:hypothetical protein TWF788_006080 [Orbilia oligospora]